MLPRKERGPRAACRESARAPGSRHAGIPLRQGAGPHGLLPCATGGACSGLWASQKGDLGCSVAGRPRGRTQPSGIVPGRQGPRGGVLPLSSLDALRRQAAPAGQGCPQSPPRTDSVWSLRRRSEAEGSAHSRGGGAAPAQELAAATAACRFCGPGCWLAGSPAPWQGASAACVRAPHTGAAAGTWVCAATSPASSRWHAHCSCCCSSGGAAEAVCCVLFGWLVLREHLQVVGTIIISGGAGA